MESLEDFLKAAGFLVVLIGVALETAGSSLVSEATKHLSDVLGWAGLVTSATISEQQLAEARLDSLLAGNGLSGEFDRLVELWFKPAGWGLIEGTLLTLLAGLIGWGLGRVVRATRNPASRR